MVFSIVSIRLVETFSSSVAFISSSIFVGTFVKSLQILSCIL